MEGVDAEKRFLEALRSMLGSESATLGSAVQVMKQAAADDMNDEDDAVETVEAEDEIVEEKLAAPTPHINLFQHPEAHPIVLDILLLQKYGPEWMLWEPETLQWRIPQDFRTSDISDLNMSKVQAMKTLHFVDTPWTEWEVFTWCAMPINGLFPDFEVMQVPTVAQCLIAIDTFGKVRTDVSWGAELKVYLGTVWRNAGVFCPVDPANFFDIDKTDTTINCSRIQEQWSTVRKTGSAPIEDTADAEQLRRMLDAHLDLQTSREQFERQLRLVLNA